MTNKTIADFMRAFTIQYHKYGAETQIECITRNIDALAFDEFGDIKICGPCGGKLTWKSWEGYKCTKCGEVYS